MFEQWPDILTVKDIKKMMQVGTNKAYEIAKQLPKIPIGVQYRFHKADLIDYINGRKQ